jgi:hypothetical protein
MMRRDQDSDYEIEDDEDDLDEDDPTHPGHRDHDLSTSANYDHELPADRKPWFLQRWLLLIVSLILVFSLVLPYVARF